MGTLHEGLYLPNPWKKLLANVKLSASTPGARSPLRIKENSNEQWLTREARNVNLKWQDLMAQYSKQNGLCFWFGCKLNPNDIFKSNYPLAMSVDRIDNDQEYEVGNIVICCRLANLGRQQCDIETFKTIITKVKTPPEPNPFLD
jgi:hypothetical protein